MIIDSLYLGLCYLGSQQRVQIDCHYAVLVWWQIQPPLKILGWISTVLYLWMTQSTAEPQSAWLTYAFLLWCYEQGNAI